MVGGKWDDRIAHADHLLAKLLLADDSSDPKELQNMIKPHIQLIMQLASGNGIV